MIAESTRMRPTRPPPSGASPGRPRLSLDGYRLLHLRRMGRHRLRTGLSVLGIAAGVALVVAMTSFVTSTTATTQATVALLGGARYEVTIPTSATGDAIEAIAALDGVTGIRRHLETPVLADGTQGLLVALEHPADIAVADAGLATPEAEALASVDGLRTGTGLPADGQLTLVGFGANPVVATVAGPLDPLIGDRYGGTILAADFATATQLRGPTATDTLLIYGDVAGGVDSVAAVAGEAADVEPVDRRAERARNSLATFFSSAVMTAAMALIVGGFLVFNTMSMTVLDHRFELASLRALGSTRRSILVGVLADATLLGAAGSMLGLVAGLALARRAVASLPDAFTQAIGTPLEVSVPFSVLAAAFILGVGTAVVASIAPARQAIDINPIEALRPVSAAPTKRGRLGNRRGGDRARPIILGTGIALTGVAALTPPGAIATGVPMGSAMVGLVCLTIGAAPMITRATIAIANRLGPSGALAATALRRNPGRVWGTTTAVIMPVAAAVALAGATLDLRTSSNESQATVADAAFFLGTTSPDTIALVQLPMEWRTAFEAIPGVHAAAAHTWLPAEQGDHIIGVNGVHGDSSYGFTRLAGQEARRQMAAGEGTIIVRQTAEAFDLSVGDIMEIPGATPPLRLPVVAISNAIVPSGGGMASISHDLLRTHYAVDGFTVYEIQLDPGADPGTVRPELERITNDYGIPVQIFTGQEALALLQKAADDMIGLIAMVLLIIVLCAAIAVANTLMASVLDRTSELAALRAIGADRDRIVTSVAVEGLAIGLTGAGLGAIAGAGYHLIMVRTIAASSAWTIDYTFRPAVLVAAVATGVAIAVLGATVPGRRAARLDLLAALAR